MHILLYIITVIFNLRLLLVSIGVDMYSLLLNFFLLDDFCINAKA